MINLTDVADRHNYNPMSKKKIVFPFGMIDRIGELARQIFYLRNLYDEAEHDITVVTYPPHLVPKTNKAVYDIMLRDLNVAHSTDSKFIWITHSKTTDYSVVRDKDTFYIFTRLDNFIIKFFEEFQNKELIYHTSLSDSEHERGYMLRDKMNIPRAAPIVTLHVRESGYLQDDNRNSYRNASIENYIPAINYLISKGFYIIRIGDRSMKCFVNPPQQLIDAPFHPEYTDFFEPYFVAVSKFFIGCTSGPDSLANALGTPVLFVNASLGPITWGTIEDLYVPKKIYSNKLDRYLTYEEFILSSAVGFYQDDHFQLSGAEFRENSPEEILRAVKEMDDRLNGSYPASQKEITKFNGRVKTIQAKAHYYRKCTIDPKVWVSYPLYATYLSKMQMSMEFCKMNPDFLGHEWPRVVEWGMEPKLEV